jgi:hypothetical protein
MLFVCFHNHVTNPKSCHQLHKKHTMALNMTRSSFLKGRACPAPAGARSQVLPPACRKPSHPANNAMRAVVVAAGADFWKSAVAVAASITLATTPAGAIGPEMFPLVRAGFVSGRSSS